MRGLAPKRDCGAENALWTTAIGRCRGGVAKTPRLNCSARAPSSGVWRGQRPVVAGCSMLFCGTFPAHFIFEPCELGKVWPLRSACVKFLDQLLATGWHIMKMFPGSGIATPICFVFLVEPLLVEMPSNPRVHDRVDKQLSLHLSVVLDHDRWGEVVVGLEDRGHDVGSLFVGPSIKVSS